MNTTTKTYTLELSNDGSPWIRVAAKAGITPDTLEISNDGSPWWGLTVAASGITRRLKAYIGGVWVAKPLKYYTGGVWTEKQLKWYSGSIWE